MNRLVLALSFLHTAADRSELLRGSGARRLDASPAPTTAAYGDRWWNADSGATITPFPCDTHSGPIQIYFPGGGNLPPVSNAYSRVAQLNISADSYTPLYPLNYDTNWRGDGAGNNQINSAAMYVDANGDSFPFIARGRNTPKLCVFDKLNRKCLADELHIHSNLGAIYKDKYYYATGTFLDQAADNSVLDPVSGKTDSGANHVQKLNAIYLVRGIDTATPTRLQYNNVAGIGASTGGVTINPNIMSGPVADFTVVEEKCVNGNPVMDDGLDTPRTQEWIIDGDMCGVYLVGLAKRGIGNCDTSNAGCDRHSLFVAKIDPSKGWKVTKYATLKNTIQWGAGNKPDLSQPNSADDDDESAFGAAFTYITSSGVLGRPRVFFSANYGWGLLELDLANGIDVTTNNDGNTANLCWNTGVHDSVTNQHTRCPGERSTVVWRMQSMGTNKNDGLNCQRGFDPPETPVPVPAPSALPIPAPTLFPTTSYEEVNCDNSTVHRYDGRAACCAALTSGALDTFVAGLNAASIKDACNAKGYG